MPFAFQQLVETFSDLQRRASATADARPILVLDAAWSPDLAREVRGCEQGWLPLLAHPGEDRADAHPRSPLLVDLTELPAIGTSWIENGFDKLTGIALFSSAGLEEMRLHLKHFTSVITPTSSKTELFRFFDARSLNCFLLTGFPEQWDDVFRGVVAFAAPADVTHGWAFYRLDRRGLRYSFQRGDGAFKERVLEGSNVDEHYKASLPFRRIAKPQYEAMKRCFRHGFRIEMARFLVRAFPDETLELNEDEILQAVVTADETIMDRGYEDEDTRFSWVVASFLAGPDFDRRDAVQAYLAAAPGSLCQRLDNLLIHIGEQQNNLPLIDLADKRIVTRTSRTGHYVKFYERSLRVIERGFRYRAAIPGENRP